MSMLALQCASASPIQLPILSCRPTGLPRTFLVFPRWLSKNSSNSLSFVVRSSSNWVPNTDQDIFRVLYETDGQAPENLPAVRSYENDLSRLTVVGAVAFEQALTAAAADGGKAADEHISSGVPTMVVETHFPGRPDEHSTIATRLFLPAKKVKEKANKLRNSLNADMFASTTSANILAMTFRQVVLHDIWSFKLLLFTAGTDRKMEDLVNPREVPEHFSLSSSDKRVLSVLAEAVCSCALEGTKEDFLKDFRASNDFFSWLKTPRIIVSSDSSVYVYIMSENDIVESAKKLVGDFSSLQGRYGHAERKRNLNVNWWLPPSHSRLHKIAGPEFSAWTSEHVASYKLQLDGSKFEDVKFQGWKKLPDNRWEVFLTHTQMVGLANILDMYYEDRYTIPEKRLSSGLIADLPKVLKSKRSSFWLKTLYLAVFAGGILVLLNVIVQLFRPHLFKGRESLVENCTVSQVNSSQHLTSEIVEVESLCCLIIRQIKEALAWSEDVTVEPDVGAWTGELPTYLKKMIDTLPAKEVASYSRDAATTTMCGEDDATLVDVASSGSSPADESNPDSQTSTALDICSYQVILSRDGRIVGFMPTSRVAVNQWASNPLSKVLYKGRKLSPGLFEPSLKIQRPDDAVELELLMSTNPALRFAFARPVR
ncbi:uncharacterized protein [Aristolochia californica]|uniref:uncharacterized protein isoform X2 n=1 Tax=Aristolochia californica TaxID=171875 RepID=UPI0035E1B5EB